MKNLSILIKSAFLVSLVLFSIKSFSQNSQASVVERNGGFYLLQGLRFQNFSQINNRLSSFLLAKIPNNTNFSGAGGYGWIRRFKVGGEGIYFYNQNKEQSVATGIAGFGGNGYVAYVLNPKSKVQVLPLLGIGGESIFLSAERNGNIGTFDQALEQPQSANFQNGTFFLRTAIQLDWKVSKSIFGLQLNYQYAPSRAWDDAFGNLENAPSDNLSLFSIQLTIGME